MKAKSSSYGDEESQEQLLHPTTTTSSFTSPGPSLPRNEEQGEVTVSLQEPSSSSGPNLLPASSQHDDIESQRAPPRICRFCFGEEGDAEDAELGALITPCLCRDTVHHECLGKWRATNARHFYGCNICKFQYQFERLSLFRKAIVRLTVPLWPITVIFLLSLALGFIPLLGDPSGSFGIHMLNGLGTIGLIYLVLIVVAFNVQHCRMTLVAARSVGFDTLPREMQLQLIAIVILRCILVAFFFGFCIVFFFPLSAFFGLMALAVVFPQAMREIGDRMVRKMEFERAVKEVTPEMASQAAAEQARATAAARQETERAAAAIAPLQEEQRLVEADATLLHRSLPPYLSLTEVMEILRLAAISGGGGGTATPPTGGEGGGVELGPLGPSGSATAAEALNPAATFVPSSGLPSSVSGSAEGGMALPSASSMDPLSVSLQQQHPLVGVLHSQASNGQQSLDGRNVLAAADPDPSSPGGVVMMPGNDQPLAEKDRK